MATLRKPTEEGLIAVAADFAAMYIKGDRDAVVRKLSGFPPAIAVYIALQMVTLAGKHSAEMHRSMTRALAHRFCQQS